MGTHKIKETVAPDGYKLLADETTFVIEKTATTSLTIANEVLEKPTGTFELTKVDVDNGSLRLQDAHFTLTNSKGEVTLITDIDGFATAKVEPGMYVLTETKAPVGYTLDKTPILIEIKENEVTKKTVYNKLLVVDNDTGIDDDDGINDGTDDDNDDTNSGTDDDTDGGTGSNTGDTNGGSTGSNTGSTTGRPTGTLTSTSGGGGYSGTSSGGYSLPQTNGQSLALYTMMGVFFVVIASFVLIRRRKSTK
jgi:LPXTG-motif cell wall-anchored protein